MSYLRKSVAELKAYTPGEQPKGSGIIKLNTNENPYPPSPAVEKALADFNAGQLRLYPDPACVKLRERIAELHGCGACNVFAGNGSDEILALCTRAFVEDDGSIGYLDPSYSLYPVLADMRNVEKRPVSLEADFTWRVPGGYGCDLFFLTNPNAPTGIQASVDHVRLFCQNAGGVVLIDEAYVDFASENCMSLALAMKNVLVLRTFSKSFSLAGLRVGYVVGPESLIDALFKIKDSYNLDRLAQVLALAALSDIEHMRRNADKIIATRARLCTALAGMGYKVFPPDANFIWVRPGGIPAEEVFTSLKKRGILIRHFPGGRTGDYLRITVGTDAEVDRLLEVLDQMHKSRLN